MILLHDWTGVMKLSSAQAEARGATTKAEQGMDAVRQCCHAKIQGLQSASADQLHTLKVGCLRTVESIRQGPSLQP